MLRPDDTPRYRLRYRLCALHLRADVVLSRGVPSRFCQARAALHAHAPLLLVRRAARDVLTPTPAHRRAQKCSRFHPLSDFDGPRRTCSASQAKHRRAPARAALKRKGEVASGGQSSSRSQSTRDDEPPPFAAGLDEASAHEMMESIMLFPLGRSASRPETEKHEPVAEAEQSMTTTEMSHVASKHSMQVQRPKDTPPAVPDTFTAQLRAAWLHGALVASGGRVPALDAHARPDCALLQVDALLLPQAPLPAPTLQATALPVAGPPFFATAGAGASLAAAGHCAPAAAAGDARVIPLGPLLPPLRPAAVLAGAGGALRFTSPPALLPASAVLRAHLAGKMLSTPDAFDADACAALTAFGCAVDVMTLPPQPPGVEGALLVDAFASPVADFPLTAAPRAALVCADAAIVAEVCAAADAADAADAAGDRGAAVAALETLLPALGRALRPGCDAALLGSVAGEALRRNWAATSARLLPALAATLAEQQAYGVAPQPQPPGTATLLHVAAAHGSAAEVAAVLRCGVAAGDPAAVGPHGITPLHLAAARRDVHSVAVLATLRAAKPHAGGAYESARDSWGFTPAELASRAPPLPPPPPPATAAARR